MNGENTYGERQNLKTKLLNNLLGKIGGRTQMNSRAGAGGRGLFDDVTIIVGKTGLRQRDCPAPGWLTMLCSSQGPEP